MFILIYFFLGYKMPFLGKALYNLFFLQGQKEYAEYESLSEEELFRRLEKFGLHFDRDSFNYFAIDTDSPEDMFDLLTSEQDKTAELYLLLFELWKKILPEKKSISIFCDELDRLIHQYDLNHQFYDEALQEKIFLLQDILDANVDAGEKPKQIFAMVSDYLAHDLESFIYDYIYEQIDFDRDTLASELIDGFYPYIKETAWFNYLRVRLFFKSPSEELATFFSHFIEGLMAKPDLELFFEVLFFLSTKECPQLFLSLFRFVVSKIETNEELAELLSVAGTLPGEEGKLFQEGAIAIRLLSGDEKFQSKNPWYLKILQI